MDATMKGHVLEGSATMPQEGAYAKACENARGLAGRLGRPIDVIWGAAPSKGPSAAFMKALRGFPSGLTPRNRIGGLFGTGPFEERWARYEALEALFGDALGPARRQLHDHPCTVHDLSGRHPRQVGGMLSPYLPRGMGEPELGELCGKAADLLFPDGAWRESWELLVLGPADTLYYPGNTVTFGLLSKPAS